MIKITIFNLMQMSCLQKLTHHYEKTRNYILVIDEKTKLYAKYCHYINQLLKYDFYGKIFAKNIIRVDNIIYDLGDRHDYELETEQGYLLCDCIYEKTKVETDYDIELSDELTKPEIFFINYIIILENEKFPKFENGMYIIDDVSKFNAIITDNVEKIQE